MSCADASPTSKDESPPSLATAAAEAAEEYLPKAAKLKEVHHAIMLEDQRTLLRDDRDSVRRYRNKTVFGDNDPAHAEEPDMGDILIADNITIGATPPNGAKAEAEPGTMSIVPGVPIDTPLWKKAATLAAVMVGCGSLPLAAVGLHSMLAAPNPPAVMEPAEPVQVPGYGVEVEKAARE